MTVGRGRSLALCAALLLVVGCGPFGPATPRGTTAHDAEALADSWLRSVSGQTQDRGWTLLHPLSRSRLYSDNATKYVVDAAAIDWTGFRWHIEPSTYRDGNYQVTIVLEGNRDPAQELADGHLIQVYASSDQVHRAAITVRIDPDGTAGVLGP